jgi:hypothetical protein
MRRAAWRAGQRAAAARRGADGQARHVGARQGDGPLLQKLGLEGPGEEAVGASCQKGGDGLERQPGQATDLLYYGCGVFLVGR